MEKLFVLNSNEMENLLTRVANMEQMLSSLMATRDQQVPTLPNQDVKPKDVARYLGISVANIYSYGRFWLPHFGEGKLVWTKEETLAHLAKGKDQLRREYADWLVKKSKEQLAEASEKCEAIESAEVIKGEN